MNTKTALWALVPTAYVAFMAAAILRFGELGMIIIGAVSLVAVICAGLYIKITGRDDLPW